MFTEKDFFQQKKMAKMTKFTNFLKILKYLHKKIYSRVLGSKNTLNQLDISLPSVLTE